MALFQVSKQAQARNERALTFVYLAVLGLLIVGGAALLLEGLASTAWGFLF